MHDSAHGHKQQAFKNDVRDDLARHAVHGELAADTNTAHHKPELIVQRVSENLAQIVFNDRKEDRETSHDSADIN